MAWTTLLNAIFAVDKPITSSTGLALRDNPVAIANGDAGAPRIQDAAMGPAATAAGRDWVNNRAALSQVGALGTESLLQYIVGSGLSLGAVVSGTNLAYATSAGCVGIISGPLASITRPPGSWRCMSLMSLGDASASNPSATTTFIRVS